MGAASPLVRVYGARALARGGAPYVSLASPASATLPPAAPTVDVSRFATYVDLQVGSECVEEMLAGDAWIVQGGRGARLSRQRWYVGARVRERARVGDSIPDDGSIPEDAVDSAIAVGVPREGADERNPDAVNLLDTWDELADADAHRFPADAFVPIANGDLDTLDRWLTLGADLAQAGTTPGAIGAGFVMPVGAPYESLSGAGAKYFGDTGPVLGFHAQALLGYTGLSDADFYRVWGSWGPAWASAGFVLVQRGFVRASGSNLLVVRDAPAVS